MDKDIELDVEFEEWRAVPGFENVFASSLGYIRSWRPSRKQWVITRGRPHPVGYLTVYTGAIDSLAHRLVALAFHPNPDGLEQVNHKNGVKTDNRAENLEWCTRSQNHIHAFKTGLHVYFRGEDSTGAKLTDEQVRAIFTSASMWRGVRRALAKQYGVAYSTISGIVEGRLWAHLKLREYKPRKRPWSLND